MAFGVPTWTGIPGNTVITACEIDITFLEEAPQTILFAALQMSFYNSAGVAYGGNHIGIMWRDNFDEGGSQGRAVNFGGYVDPPGVAAGVPYVDVGEYNLDSGTNLNTNIFRPANNPNGDRTCQYNFKVGQPVRLRVEHMGSGTWRAFVDGVAYRDTFFPGTTKMGAHVFWTEYGTVPCGVKFSRFSLVSEGGTVYQIGGVQVNHGSGAGEKRVFLDASGLIMDTNRTPSVIANGAVVTMPYVDTAIPESLIEVRIDTDGNIREDAQTFVRVTNNADGQTAWQPDGPEVVVRIDTSGDIRLDTDNFVRVVVSGETVVPEPVFVSIPDDGPNERVLFDTPPTALVDAFEAGFVKVVRYVDIYESDNVTPWRTNVGVLDGNVTVDMSRDERRILDIQIAGEDGSIVFGPDEFWYDKIIKPYRGITYNGVDMVTCLGEFMIDRIVRPHFPDTLSVSCRDFTKKLLLAKLAETTTFRISLTPESIIQALANGCGIPSNKLRLPATGRVLPTSSTFDRLTPVFTVMKTIANGFGYEIYFDNFGVLTMRPFVDPVSAPISHTFQTGPRGTLVSYELTTDDSRLFNEVVVYGSGNNNKLIAGRAENNEPGSPTRISRIGRRTMEYPSQFVSTQTEANDLARRLLGVAALEQYDASMNSVVAPWLEAGDAVGFIAPTLEAFEPTRYLLTNFTIPLSLSPMSSNVKRVHIVGA